MIDESGDLTKIRSILKNIHYNNSDNQKIKIDKFPILGIPFIICTNLGWSMRVIAKRTIRTFWEKPGCDDAEAPLQAWHDIVIKAQWLSPQDVKNQFGNASICGNNRVVFNIGGNKYRLVAEIQYRVGIVWVKFIGTHTEYDKINVETINEY